MKKLFTITALIGVSLFLSSTAMAITSATTSGGAHIQIDDATAPDSGTELDFDPSPGVAVSWNTTANSYSFTSVNESASNGNRNEYGIWSEYSGYYQKEDADSATPAADLTAAPAPTGADPFAGWIMMGGAS